MQTVFIATVRDSVIDVVLAFDSAPTDDKIVEAYNDEMESDTGDISELEVLSIVETVIYS